MTTRSFRSSRSSWYWPSDSSMSVSDASVTSESSASLHSQRSKELARSSWPSIVATCSSSRRLRMLVQFRRLLAVLADGLQLVLGSYRLGGHGGRGARRVGDIGDVVLGQECDDRGHVATHIVLEGRRVSVQFGLTRGAVGVLRSGPGSQRFPRCDETCLSNCRG